MEALVKFVTVRPVGSKNKEVLRQDLELFQSVVAKMQEADYDSLARTMKEEDAELLIDYLHRYMQFVGESEKEDIRSNTMLKLYERIVKEYGPSIIAKANFRGDTLVCKILNYDNLTK